MAIGKALSAPKYTQVETMCESSLYVELIVAFGYMNYHRRWLFGTSLADLSNLPSTEDQFQKILSTMKQDVIYLRTIRPAQIPFASTRHLCLQQLLEEFTPR